MPTERAEVAAAVLDGRIYVVGAYSGARDANEAFDPQANAWQQLQPLPRPFNHACAVGLNGVLNVIGGFDPTTGNRPVDTVFAFDPTNDTWTTQAPLPTPRGALTCASIDNDLRDRRPVPCRRHERHGSLRSIHRYVASGPGADANAAQPPGQRRS
jgi:N-acetylneuraminic acid mutarotase